MTYQPWLLRAVISLFQSCGLVRSSSNVISRWQASLVVFKQNRAFRHSDTSQHFTYNDNFIPLKKQESNL